MEICDWMINPFTANVNKAGVTCQEELIEIRRDDEAKTNCDCSGYMRHCHSHVMINQIPNTWKITFRLLVVPRGSELQYSKSNS